MRARNTEVVHVLIDCDACAVRGDACGSCVVTTVLSPVRPGAGWDWEERRALKALSDGGLLPQLRFMPMPAEVQATAWSPRRQAS
jgi:hypothetical protein